MKASIVEQIEKQAQYIDMDDWEIRFENIEKEIAEYYTEAMSEPNADMYWLEKNEDIENRNLWLDIYNYRDNIYPFLEYDDPIELANEWLTYNPEVQE